MKYMLLFKPEVNPPPGIHACRKDLPEMRNLMAELHASGVLVATEGLQPSDTGARVRMTQGKLSVQDGPYAEAKELVAGFCIVEVASKADAVSLAQRFLTIAGGGQADVLEVAR
jgi:hypothetical protein